MAKPKRSKLPKQTNVDSKGQGIPESFNILLITKTEPLNHLLSLKIWGSVATYIEVHGGSDFVREAILEKLRRIQDKTLNKPIRCARCANLVDEKDELYLKCTKQFGLLDRKFLNEPWLCEDFKPKKGDK